MAKLRFKRLPQYKNVFVEHVIRMPPNFVMCINNDDDSLELGNVYYVKDFAVVSDELSIINISLGDYVLPVSAKKFIPFPFSNN